MNASNNLSGSVLRYWREGIAQDGFWRTLHRFAAGIGEFVRESTPGRRRQRYGDADYDWDYRVDTTSATVGWRDRLLGQFHSPYQPTEPALFHEMLGSLKIDFQQFTFIDLGSGKGRVLLMASDYPFHRILGVELLPALNRVALENIQRYKSDSQRCFALETVCSDARDFVFPPEPTVLYLFNPLPEAGLVQVLRNLDGSLRENSRTVYLLYHNPVLEPVLQQSNVLKKVGGTRQYSVYFAEVKQAPR